jgi:peptide/nickel transport system substrate-binding protein
MTSVGAVINPDFIFPRDVYKYGGDFRLARTSDFDTLNPFSGSGGAWMVTITTYEGLVMVDPEWGVAPWLAASWEISDDDLTYTFYLQPNATWADGLPVTAEDVKYTFDQWKIQQLPRMAPYVKNIESVTVINPKTVQMKLYKKDVTFLSRHLSWPALMIVPKHVWENIPDWNTFDNSDPNLHYGSGPFKLKEWKKGEYCIVEANENYWQGRPYIDTITHIVIPMRDMQLMAFEKGELSVMSPIYGNEVPRFLDPAEYKIYQIEDSGQPNFYANMRRRPGDDINFRKALWYCLDREKILEAAYYGYGVIPTHMLATPYAVGGWIPPETVVEPQNLTKAAEILEAAGYKDIDGDGWREHPNGDKMTLMLTVTDADIFVKAGELIVPDLKSIGININLKVIPGGQWASVILVTKDYDLTYFRYGPGGGDPLEPLSWQTSWGENWIGFFNETYDEVYLQCADISDPDERRPLIFELQRILAENYVYVPHICNKSLKVLDIAVWDPLPNSMPWGPWSNLQSWHYYNVHLKGAPEARLIDLSFEVISEGIQKEPIPIKATIKDDKGSPIEGIYVDFVVGGVTIGSKLTDVNGVAEFTWVPVAQGTYNVNTYFAGTTAYQSIATSTKTVQIGAETPPPPPPTPPDNTMLYLGIAAVVIIGVALIFVRTRK